MKEIYGPASYDTELSEQDVIAYVVKNDNDILALIGKTKQRADLEDYTDEEVLNDHLIEYGVRPTSEPVIVVVEANDERNLLRFTYVNKKMFEV